MPPKLEIETASFIDNNNPYNKYSIVVGNSTDSDCSSLSVSTASSSSKTLSGSIKVDVPAQKFFPSTVESTIHLEPQTVNYSTEWIRNFDLIPIDHQTEYTPEKVIFNPPATVVFWKDGDKTVVKCMKDEPYSPYFGFLAALGKKIFSSNAKIQHILKPFISQMPNIEPQPQKKCSNVHKNNKKGTKNK